MDLSQDFKPQALSELYLESALFSHFFINIIPQNLQSHSLNSRRIQVGYYMHMQATEGRTEEIKVNLFNPYYIPFVYSMGQQLKRQFGPLSPPRYISRVMSSLSQSLYL